MRRRRKSNIKYICIIIVVLIIIVIVSIIAITFSKNKDTVGKNNISSIEDVNLNFNNINEYKVDLQRFNINNNGKQSLETSNGINKMLNYAKEEGFNKVTMPKGEYLISENEPIVMVSDMILDLNGSIFKINTNLLQKYTVVNFNKCNNAKLTNGTILGDRDSHDYTTLKGSHEWTCGIVFNESENCELESVTVKDFPGYGISSSLGTETSNLINGIIINNLVKGNIDDKGLVNSESGTIRTIEAIDISGVGENFELGYNKGYMGYPFMQSRVYDSYFYDENMDFISSSKDCEQYKKTSIPKGTKYVNYVFYQDKVPSKGDEDFNNSTVFITNYKSPYKIKVINCTIENNKSLGMGLCGGRNFIIENNTFKNNGGGAPGYAIDLEDGWEYMQGYLIKNNKFIENSNDVVVCAGDNIIFEENEFSSTVYMYGRATNYKFLNNKFENISMGINYEYSSNTECSGNTYINSKLAISNKNANGKLTIKNETLVDSSINSMPEDVSLVDSTIKSDNKISTRLTGNYENCNIGDGKAELISTKMSNCEINNSSLNAQGICDFVNSTITNSFIGSTVNTENVTIKKNNIKDSSISIATWGSICSIYLEENNIEINKDSFVNISAGKVKELRFKGNNVKNLSDKSILNVYDTTYSKPGGKAVIDDNTFNQDEYLYVFDGVKIDSGIFELEYKNNNGKGRGISERYENSKYFKVKK